MNNIQETEEKMVRDFCNQMAMQLNVSNDTIEAVRLFRKEIPNLLTTTRTSTLEEVREILKKYEHENDSYDPFKNLRADLQELIK
jgi:hypothetical protein